LAITQHDITTGLRELGLKAGDSVLTHSSLSSFGQVEGGADAVIGAIIEAVSPGGTVLFPTLTGNSELSAQNPPIFDVLNTPCWTGAIPETARKKPGFIRSAHPTHSVCAFGDRARWFTEDHEHCPTPCGFGSPYDKLTQAGGSILLIGVTHNSNTSMHFVEEIAGVPWHMQEGTALATITYADREVAKVPVTLHKYGMPRDFTRIEPEMLLGGIQVNGRIGESTIRLVKAREMAYLVLARVEEDSSILLPER
jgi:aminoglycoside 3-N-acetyltransferase